MTGGSIAGGVFVSLPGEVVQQGSSGALHGWPHRRDGKKFKSTKRAGCDIDDGDEKKNMEESEWSMSL